MKDAKDGRMDVVESLVGRAIRAGAPLRALLARRDLAHAKGGDGRDGHGSGDLERRDWLDHLWSSDEAKVGDGVGRSGDN